MLFNSVNVTVGADSIFMIVHIIYRCHSSFGLVDKFSSSSYECKCYPYYYSYCYHLDQRYLPPYCDRIDIN